MYGNNNILIVLCPLRAKRGNLLGKMHFFYEIATSLRSSQLHHYEMASLRSQ